MDRENDPLVIYTTFETAVDAKKVGRELVETRLAACVNIIPGMTAVYHWEGAVHEAGEVVMLIKSRKGRRADVLEKIRALHPYQTPAIVVIDPMEVDRDFADWIAAQTAQS